MSNKLLCNCAIFLSAVTLWNTPYYAAAQRTCGFRVLNAYTHDQSAYTQGLLYRDGVLYESTGLYGKSDIRRVDLESGRVLASVPLPRDFFGEGATMLGNMLYQLTWREGVCFVYDATTLALRYRLQFSGEGWGLADNGRQLIMSDGSHIIRFLSPQTMREERRISVTGAKGKIGMLNELELVEGELWANVYTTDHIVRIDTASGKALGIIDLAGILPAALRTPHTDVLNGIAYDPQRKRLFVTGKNWKRLFEIEIVEKRENTNKNRNKAK